jgi:transposase InsO family protein
MRQAVALEQKLVAARAVEAAGDRGAVIAAFVMSLHVTARTVRRWAQQLREGALGTKRPGPDRLPVARTVRQGIVMLLSALGASVSEHTVKALHGDATYSVIRGMKRRFRAVCAKLDRRGKSRLEWRRPGAAWAMDFTQPGAELEGGHTHLLMVRDLASGYRLASVPCKGEKAVTVIRTLKLLFAAFGAPLVIKHDGGPGFCARKTENLLARHGVLRVRSPAYTPAYNGSIERSLGWDKVRIARIAEREGRSGYWTAEDIEQARVQANVTLMPRGLGGRTPEEAFEARRRITEAEREAFKQTVEDLVQAELRKHQDESGILTVPVGIEVLERRAVTRALVEHGYLTIRRGRISTPFPEPQPDRNS